MRYADGLFGRKDAPPSRPVASGGGAVHGPVPGTAGPVSTPRPAPHQAAPAEVAGRSEDAGGSRLIVGPNIKLRGVEIDDCDTLVVEGRVEATMVSRSIQIAESGSFKGTADLDTAEIRGGFDGELTVRGRLVVHATGRVSGKVRYGKLLVQEGGELLGDVGTLAAGPPA